MPFSRIVDIYYENHTKLTKWLDFVGESGNFSVEFRGTYIYLTAVV